MNSLKSISGRAHPLWVAYILHRLSGLALALFLPLHFWVLAMAMTDPVKLDGFLNMNNAFIIKLAEFGLVFLLAVHLFGGLRLMAMEWLPWSPSQKTMAALAVAVSLLLACLFFLQVI
jgi:fumarate reductase subunit D